MRLIKLVPADTNFDFTGKRIAAFSLSLAMIFLSLLFFIVRGLNLGIDFQGGIMIDVKFEQAPDIPSLRTQLDRLDLGEVEIQEFGEPENILIRVQRQEGDEKAQQAAITAVKEALGEGPDHRRTEFVGPKVGAELIVDAATAVCLSLLAIMIYIWFRFEWQFGIGAVVALMHDVITTIGLFAILQLEFNLSTIAAILTIAGYSINDTVVVYDRVRENLRKFRKMALPDLLNRSINQTLARTTMTSVTTLLALLALYFFGGEVIHDFVFAMIWGVFVGTYSSIFVAAPLLIKLKLRRDFSEGPTAPAPTGEETLP